MRVLVLVLACLAFARAGWTDEAENITVLTVDDFDEFIDQHPLVLVDFFMPVSASV
jgi:hypothetical protein